MDMFTILRELRPLFLVEGFQGVGFATDRVYGLLLVSLSLPSLDFRNALAPSEECS